MKRLRELDFLRGLAIILVLLRHQYVFRPGTVMGWIGVDLFFVLSGFLVSGLLFKEFLKFGDVQPKRFLIRRGFKIYPIYYMFYLPYLVPIFYNSSFNWVGFLSDMTFTQNYINGYGYAYSASWSLAVEEHFYFGLALLLWVGTRRNFLLNTDVNGQIIDASQFLKGIGVVLVLCLVLRFISNIAFPYEDRNFTMTHLRIDSLLAGVGVAYLYYFKQDSLTRIFQSYKTVFLFMAFMGLAWTPFIEPVNSFFVKTIGFTLLYFSFSIILIYFLTTQNINYRLNRFLSSTVVSIISKIGYCSYSIYVIHSIVNFCFHKLMKTFNLFHYDAELLVVRTVLTLLSGLFMTYVIEAYYLRVRDKYIPSRV